MWEGKVFAAAAADVDADADADAAETDWKHKVTPERGDLMMTFPLQTICMKINVHVITKPHILSPTFPDPSTKYPLFSTLEQSKNIDVNVCLL